MKLKFQINETTIFVWKEEEEEETLNYNEIHYWNNKRMIRMKKFSWQRKFHSKKKLLTFVEYQRKIKGLEIQSSKIKNRKIHNATENPEKVKKKDEISKKKKKH